MESMIIFPTKKEIYKIQEATPMICETKLA